MRPGGSALAGAGRSPVSKSGLHMEIKSSVGYVSITAAPGLYFEARRAGHRATGQGLEEILRFVGVPQKEAQLLASKIRHPSNGRKMVTVPLKHASA